MRQMSCWPAARSIVASYIVRTGLIGAPPLARKAEKSCVPRMRAAGGAPMSPVRTMYEATLEEERPGLLACRIHGSGFLYHMVRNLMGTIANVGLGVLQPADIDRILASRDRAQASATAPAHGLYLLHVAYGEEATAASQKNQKNVEKTVDR